jgi:hemoglobin-like flavoprotein
MSPTSVPAINSLDTKLIQSTYLIIKAQSDEFATSFYQILFDKYPQVRPLFAKTDMKKQRDKLIESLDLVLVNVNNSDAFTSILKDLGKRHVKYGAVLTDYPLVGDALLQALEKHLGEDWNPDVKQAWTLAYQTIADMMAIGAKAAMEKESKSQVRWETTNQNDTEIEENPSSTNPLINILFLVVCLSVLSVCGYAAWSLLQPQSNNVPNPAEVSRANRQQ